MGKAIFKSNRSEFNRKHAAFIDMFLGRLAMAVEIALKTTSGMPVRYGNMKSQTRHFKNKVGNWRTEVDTSYAAAQETGMINGHPIKNYSTQGTSAGFFRRSIDTMNRQRDNIAQETKNATGL